MADDGREPPERGSKRKPEQDAPSEDSGKRPRNSAPDAVKDPNEKSGGKPGLPPKPHGGEADPGAG